MNDEPVLSPDSQLRVLVVEDDEVDFQATRRFLRRGEFHSFSLEWRRDMAAGIAALRREPFDICLLDFRLGPHTGVEFLKGIAEAGLNVPVIVLTGQGDRETDIRVMEAGAAEYLDKGTLTAELLERTIRYTLQNRRVLEAQRRSERKLARALDRLERSNKEIQEFAAIVSHDLKSPLTSIIGFLEILREANDDTGQILAPWLSSFSEPERKKLVHALQEDIPEAIHYIGSAASNMRTLIEAIVDLSRTGQRSSVLETVDTALLVDEAVKALAFQIEEKKAQVSIGAMPTIVSDRLGLQQVFGNLLSNAVKYLVPGRPGEISVTAEGGEDEAVFHVRDNGRGIEAKDIPHVFEMFRRGGKLDTEGSGMGLAHVRARLHHMGGRVWCESSPGQGSTFNFSLPLEMEPR
jgi:signal transduction histidine kinase